MLTRVYLVMVLLTATPIWSQMGVVPYDMPATQTDDTPMLTPPPVSGEAYPTTVGFETRSNYFVAGLILNTAYNDNVLGSDSITPAGDVTYSIWPTIALNQTTPRQHTTLIYSPGFTFYQHTSSLNAADQNVAANFQYRLSQHTAISFDDSFQKSSNVFSQPYLFSGGGISGSSQSVHGMIIAPFADQLINTTNVGLNYQFSRNGMIGASGIFAENNYPNPTEVPGLYNSNSVGSSAFYCQRLSSGQYIGFTYQYLRTQGNPVNAQTSPSNASTDVQTHTLFPFYTIYFNPTLSLSFSGGPQHFDAEQSPSPSVHSWAPSAMVSIGWQRSHTNLVASYLRTVSAGLGLPGAFDSNSANTSDRWQLARTWTVGLGASYAINKNITPLFSSSNPGGHSISGNLSVQHSISEHLKAELGYARLHQSYSGIEVISNAPDSNREFISITYQLTRPIGR